MNSNLEYNQLKNDPPSFTYLFLERILFHFKKLKLTNFTIFSHLSCEKTVTRVFSRPSQGFFLC